MRDPKRIPRMLKLLEVVWVANPDLRLTQLVSAAASLGGWSQADLFYCEDDATLAGLVQLCAGDVKINKEER
jgi:uncharacterized protein YihD (DUF1040 family)